MQEAGAAVVAAQLLAFYREPVRHRPRLTHGREPFSGGLLVFRFAQGRFPQALMRDLPAARRGELREAALSFIRQVCFWNGASHYQVLCVAPGARREAIKEHYHGLMALIHPDRQEAGALHWPAEYAQRVNKAYEVLSDDARRREYEAGLHKETVGSATLAESLLAESEMPSPGTFRKARGTAGARLRKPVLYVSLALSLLFFVQVWWAGQVPGEYSAIPSSAPFELSLRWMREAYTSGQKPPAGTESAPAKRAPEEPAFKASFLEPIWRALSGPSDEPSAPRAAKAGAKLAVAAASGEPAVTERKAGEAGPAPPPARTAAAPVERAPERMAEKAALPIGAAQAATIRKAAERGLTADEMESMVARVVTYYEAGDTDKLLGLYDPSTVGLWEAMSLRHDFEEFFRATKTRRLRLQRVSWDSAAAGSARVKGGARLIADYHDETGRIERQVALEMDVVSRDGQPRLARLSLFPHEK